MEIIFKELKSKRLVYRKLEEMDADKIFELRSHPEVNKYLDREPMKSLSEADGFINKINSNLDNGRWLYWGIVQNDQPGLIGTICLWQFSEPPYKAEIGYELLPSFQGRGFMKEALAVVIQYGMEKLGLSILEAATHKNNQASIRLLEKNGFVPSRKEIEKDMILYQLQS